MATSANGGGRSKSIEAVFCIEPSVYARLSEVFRHLFVGLVDEAVHVRLVSSTEVAESLTVGPVQMIVQGRAMWPFVRAQRTRLREALAKSPPSIVHAVSKESFDVAAYLADEFDADLVLMVTSDVDVAAMRRIHLERGVHVVAPTQPLYDEVVAAGIAGVESVELIRLGVPRSDAPGCFSRRDGTPTVLCTADLDANNGVPQLIDAAGILHKRDRRLLVFLVGVGPKEAQLRRRVADKGLQECITFARPKADTVQVMRGADIFVRPAPERAITLNSLVAMACGASIVAVCGGMIDHCLDAETAVVCPDGRPETLAAGIESLLMNPAYARQLGAAGVAYMTKNHSVAHMSEQTYRLYQRLTLQRQTYSLTSMSAADGTPSSL